MPLVAWLSLAVVVLVIAVGTTVTTVKTIRAWRAFRSLAHAAGGTLDGIMQRASDVEDRLTGAGGTAERLDVAVARLRRSTSLAAVLADALVEVRASAGRARAALPRK